MASLETIRLSNLGPSGRCVYLSDLSVAVRLCPLLTTLR